MNRSRIDWTDHTWNPITGCKQGCHYCYAAKMTARFSGDVRYNQAAGGYIRQGDMYILEKKFVAATGGTLSYPFGFAPTYHEYRFGQGGEPAKLKRGFNIFVGAMADIFGEWIPDEYILDIFRECQRYPIHNYLFLTKNPERYSLLNSDGKLPAGKNMWYGSTVTKSNDIYFRSSEHKTFLSMEPLMENLTGFNSTFKFKLADWVIIGAETGRSKTKVVPDPKWISNIVDYCRHLEIPVFMKDSLVPVIGEENMLREFPPELQQERRSEKVRERLEGECVSCKNGMDKAEMIALSCRSKRGEYPKQVGHICKSCFRNQCNEWGIIPPEMECYKHESD